MAVFKLNVQARREIPEPVPDSGAEVYDLLAEGSNYYDGFSVDAVGERALPRTFGGSTWGYAGYGPRQFFIDNELKVIRGYDIEGIIRPTNQFGAQAHVSWGLGYLDGVADKYVTTAGLSAGDEVISAHVPLQSIPLRKIIGNAPLGLGWDGVWIRLPQNSAGVVTPAGFLTEYKLILDDPPEFTFPSVPAFIPTSTPVQMTLHLAYPSGEPVVGYRMQLHSLDGGILVNGVEATPSSEVMTAPSDAAGDIVIDLLGTVPGSHTLRINEQWQTGFSPSFKDLVLTVTDTGEQEFWTDLTGVF